MWFLFVGVCLEGTCCRKGLLQQVVWGMSIVELCTRTWPRNSQQGAVDHCRYLRHPPPCSLLREWIALAATEWPPPAPGGKTAPLSGFTSLPRVEGSALVLLCSTDTEVWGTMKHQAVVLLFELRGLPRFAAVAFLTASSPTLGAQLPSLTAHSTSCAAGPAVGPGSAANRSRAPPHAGLPPPPHQQARHHAARRRRRRRRGGGLPSRHRATRRRCRGPRR
jgi:hypothetical protein